MPLTSKGEEIKRNMEKEYGKAKGESVFYASKNKGTISGVDGVGMECDDEPAVSPYYGDPVIDPTQTSSGTMMMPDSIGAQPSSSVPDSIGAQPSSSVPEQPSGMREPIDAAGPQPGSAGHELAEMAAVERLEQLHGHHSAPDSWGRMTGNRDFSGDENSRLGGLPREVSHRDMQRMAEGFGYNQGYNSNPYGRK